MFPCPAGCVFSLGRKSSSSNRSSRRVLYLIVQPVVIKLVEKYCFSRVPEGTLDSFWARFWHCSVLQSHCVSLSGRVRAFSASGGRAAAAATGAAGGCCVSLCKQWYRSLFFRGRRQGRQPLNSAPPAPHEYADKCVTSVPERLEL